MNPISNILALVTVKVLALNMQQAIAWTSSDLDLWQNMALPGHSELTLYL